MGPGSLQTPLLTDHFLASVACGFWRLCPLPCGHCYRYTSHQFPVGDLLHCPGFLDWQIACKEGPCLAALTWAFQ